MAASHQLPLPFGMGSKGSARRSGGRGQRPPGRPPNEGAPAGAPPAASSPRLAASASRDDAGTQRIPRSRSQSIFTCVLSRIRAASARSIASSTSACSPTTLPDRRSQRSRASHAGDEGFRRSRCTALNQSLYCRGGVFAESFSRRALKTPARCATSSSTCSATGRSTAALWAWIGAPPDPTSEGWAACEPARPRLAGAAARSTVRNVVAHDRLEALGSDSRRRGSGPCEPPATRRF